MDGCGEQVFWKAVFFQAEDGIRVLVRSRGLGDVYKRQYLLSDDQTRTVTNVNGCKYKGVNFVTPEKAVKALAKMYQYSKWLKCENEN